LIFQQSAELAKKVAAWNKQCGDKPSYDETCMKKRYALSEELGKFVALVNNELDGLRDVSPDASDDFIKEVNGRRKIMKLEVRNALHIIRCLGVPASESQCSAESAAIDAEKTALQAEYKQTHAAFDGSGFLYPSPFRLLPKNRNGPSFNSVGHTPPFQRFSLLRWAGGGLSYVFKGDSEIGGVVNDARAVHLHFD